MEDIAKLFIILGLIFVFIGICLIFFLSTEIAQSWPETWMPGRLPGDIRIESEHSAFYFPITTCLLASGGLWALVWLGRKIFSYF